MAPRARNSRGRGRGRGRPRGGRTARASAPPTPPREEVIPEVQALAQLMLLKVGDVLREFINGFLASLAQTILSQKPL